MKAFILAAGKGTRLMPLTAEIPKALLELKEGLTPLDFQLDLLTKYGFPPSDIFIIGGYRFEKLKRYSEIGVNLVFNKKYDSLNNIYTFLLASNFTNGEDFLILNVDTIFDGSLLDKLIKTPGSAMVVDNVKVLGDEEMKVKIADERIVEISKFIPPENAHGEYIGISKYSRSEATVIFDKIRDMLENGEGHRWYEDAINLVLDRVKISPVFTEGKKWIEIDTPQDLEKARGLVHDLQNN